jgi:hypothetical protein
VQSFKVPNSNRKDDLVLTVDLPHSKQVFMKAHRFQYSNEPQSVVQVLTKSFLEFWRRNPNGIHSEVANGNPETWVHHYKYKNAALGFAEGKFNPVPCAEVFCEMEKGIDGKDQMTLTFSNGITRTIWLVSNGCIEFPIVCATSQSEILWENAGNLNVKPVYLNV